MAGTHVISQYIYIPPIPNMKHMNDLGSNLRVSASQPRKVNCLSLSRAAVTVLGMLGMTAATAVRADFVPGAGGSIPLVAPFQAIPNQIAGLRVSKIDRTYNLFGTGTSAYLDLYFPAPVTHGASGYTLQRSPDGVAGWTDFGIATVDSTHDNFSFNPGGSYFYRLLVSGGPKDGYTSNVVQTSYPTVDTYFSQYGCSNYSTAIQSPWVGYGMTASFVVKKISDGSVVSGGLTYQWYRVNPQTYEMTPITGATGLTYITTLDDVGGWLLFCRATGDDVTVGGCVQVQAGGPVMIQNNSFASNISSSGFRLNLDKSLPSLAPADLQLSYQNGTETVMLPITSITPVAGNASFDIAVAVPAAALTLTLSTSSNVWVLGSEMRMGPYMVFFIHYLNITVPAAPAGGFTDWIAANSGIPEGRTGLMDCNGPLNMPNLTAYAMGLNPLLAVPTDLPQVTSLNALAGTLHFIYRRAKNLSDASFTPRFSTDLQTWSNATVLSQAVVGGGSDWELIDATIGFTPGSPAFLKLAAQTIP